MKIIQKHSTINSEIKIGRKEKRIKEIVILDWVYLQGLHH